MTWLDVLSLVGEIVVIALLTGLIMYALLALAGGRGWLRTVLVGLGLTYGVVAGLGVVLMELVVRG